MCRKGLNKHSGQFCFWLSLELRVHECDRMLFMHVCMNTYTQTYISSLAPVEKQVGWSNHSICSNIRVQLWTAVCCGSNVLSGSSGWSLFMHSKTWWKLKCLQQWLSSQPKQFYDYMGCWRLKPFQYCILVEICYWCHGFS